MEINFSSDDEVDDGLNDFVLEAEPTTMPFTVPLY
jgi:hypothetical protein